MLLVLCALGLGFRHLLESPWLGGGFKFFFVSLWGPSRFSILDSGWPHFVASSILCWASSVVGAKFFLVLAMVLFSLSSYMAVW